MVSLAAEPEKGVAWLRKQLGPPVEAKAIPKLIDDLASPEFPVRDKATEALRKTGHVALPMLLAALKREHPLERRKRLEGLAKPLQETLVAHELCMCRIIDLLEQINTPAAREFLCDIAAGGYGQLF